MVNGKGPSHSSAAPVADGTMQDVTQSLETNSADLDNTYKIEDIEESLLETETGSAKEKQQEELENFSAGEREHLLSDSPQSAPKHGHNDSQEPVDQVTSDDREDDAEQAILDGIDERESLLKAESKGDEEVERRPNNGSVDNDSINV